MEIPKDLPFVNRHNGDIPIVLDLTRNFYLIFDFQ